MMRIMRMRMVMMRRRMRMVRMVRVMRRRMKIKFENCDKIFPISAAAGRHKPGWQYWHRRGEINLSFSSSYFSVWWSQIFCTKIPIIPIMIIMVTNKMSHFSDGSSVWGLPHLQASQPTEKFPWRALGNLQALDPAPALENLQAIGCQYGQ